MADKFKSIAKGGWHPERDRAAAKGGQSESRLGSRVGGMLGRGGGDKSHVEEARNHQSAPLSSLKDPSTFAPPPKRADYNRDPTASIPARTATAGASSVAARRRADEDTNAATKPKPNLPPRLPPRQNSNPNEYAPTPPPTYNEATQQGGPSEGIMNRGALHRLGQAGVSVPGLGLGRNAAPPPPPRHNAAAADTPVSSPASAGHGSQVGALQNRFSNMSAAQTGSDKSATGTSWADKQAALRTASNLRDDPSKVSASDVRGAASTANNFQQRHGAQVASGWKAASGFNNKYGITGRVNGLASQASTTAAPGQPTPPQSPVTSSSGDIGKKAPPPPPPRRKELGSEPPPIPLGSKPKF